MMQYKVKRELFEEVMDITLTNSDIYILFKEKILYIKTIILHL